MAVGKAALKAPSEFAAADEINEALVIYTGFGKSTFPRARSGDLVARFGPEQAAELKARVLALLEELQQQPPLDSGKRTRQSVTERAIEQLRPQHPELDATGLKALRWTYSFGLR